MTVRLRSEESGSVWGSFDRVRHHLYAQFREVEFRVETGLSPDQLRAEAEAFLIARPDLPRVLQKAHVYRIVLTRGQLALDPRDWFVDKLKHGDLVQDLCRQWLREAQAGPVRDEAAWFRQAFELGVGRGLLDTGHISPGWENMFAGGLTGLIAQARECRARAGDRTTETQRALWEAVAIVCDATIQLSERFAGLAEELAETAPEHAARLRAIADCCRRVPAHAPQTFHEALQFAWLMHELIEMEGECVRSMGHFDRVFYPYYHADLEAGRLTREQAKELIKFAWFKHHARTQGRNNGKNFLFGGQRADGSDATNELTYLALEAYEELGIPDPKLSVRFFPGTPDRLYQRVADLIRRGHNSFVLMNDVPALTGLVKRGKTLEDARTYLPIGCYEPAVDGKEAACTMNLVINLAKAVELALADGVNPLSGERIGPPTGDPRGFSDFGQLFDAYTAQLEAIIARAVDCVRAHERQWPRINPSPLLAATIADCLERGQDIGEGGPHYNSVGCVGAGLANASDSLLALRRGVFEERHCSMEELLAALDSDFAGQERLRLYLQNRVPKWGNDAPDADDMARRVADHYCQAVHAHTNARGGPCQAALFTLDYQWTLGRATGALPDGRKARTGLAPGVGASTGLDKAGVTGLLNSVSRLDFTETPNGAVLDVTLHPTAVSGDDGLAAFVALIKSFFARGGYALQFNIFDAETLRDAQRHPERYASLQIRVTGWSVYFTTLSKDEQDQFIARTTHGL
jgi:pyruvate formate-lyase/glycerol dehydratase family glycyl radical enzyme